MPAGSACAFRRRAVTLRPDDEVLLAELSRDGRATHAALAAATHWHESTVRRRIEELQELGLLYFDIDASEAFLGVQAPALLWLEVEPRAPGGHRPGDSRAPGDPVRRGDDRSHQPGRQRPVPGYPAHV